MERNRHVAKQLEEGDARLYHRAESRFDGLS